MKMDLSEDIAIYIPVMNFTCEQIAYEDNRFIQSASILRVHTKILLILCDLNE